MEALLSSHVWTLIVLLSWLLVLLECGTVLRRISGVGISGSRLVFESLLPHRRDLLHVLLHSGQYDADVCRRADWFVAAQQHCAVLDCVGVSNAHLGVMHCGVMSDSSSHHAGCLHICWICEDERGLAAVRTAHSLGAWRCVRV
jgi:hypothetical protein